jgi:hypothetical protein
MPKQKVEAGLLQLCNRLFLCEMKNKNAQKIMGLLYIYMQQAFFYAIQGERYE